MQFHVQPLSLDAFGEPLHAFDAMTVSVCNLRPTSVGSVRLASREFGRNAPIIELNYLTTAADQHVAAQSVRVARHIMAQPAMAAFAPIEVQPGAAFETQSELVRAAGLIGTTIFHPVGTCKMGAPDNPLAVVDWRLRARGIDKLRVCDASIMPTIVSGNTCSPTLMVAERTAAWMAQRLDGQQ